MLRQTFDDVQAFRGLSHFHVELPQRKRRVSHIGGLLLLTTLAGFTVAPQFLIAGLTFNSPEIRAILAEQPIIAVELALATGFWAFLVLWPLRRIVRALVCERQVQIRDGVVFVVDRTPIATSTWSLPLTAFEGVAHNVRSSLSGVSHELVLVHADRRRNVLLGAAPTIGQPEVREVCRALKLPELDAAVMYRWGGPPGVRRATANLKTVTP